MKLKIISNGTKPGTRVVNAETGEEVDDVSLVTWSIDAKQDIATAVISLNLVEAEITSDFDVSVLPPGVPAGSILFETHRQYNPWTNDVEEDQIFRCPDGTFHKVRLARTVVKITDKEPFDTPLVGQVQSASRIIERLYRSGVMKPNQELKASDLQPLGHEICPHCGTDIWISGPVPAGGLRCTGCERLIG